MTDLPPGRELDAMIAERVMGWTRLQPGNDVLGWVTGPAKTDLRGLPDFSTDIAAAWEVALHIRSESRLFDFDVWVMGDDEWGARFVTDKEYKAWGDTAPHAICLAALKAVRHE